MVREGDDDFIPDRGLRLCDGRTWQLEYRERISAHRRDPPRPQLRFRVNHRKRLVEINHIDSKPHAQSMNAMGGDNPEAVAVTEVMGIETQQASEAGPMRVGNGEGGGQERPSSLIKGLASRRKLHCCPPGSSAADFVSCVSNEEPKPDPIAGSIR